jgi:hypothetical protein
MRSVLVLTLGALLILPRGGSAQDVPGWSPWGGPDSPGGMFGGNPLDADANRDRAVTHDEVWTWLRRRFDLADQDRSGTLEPHEVPAQRDAQAAFRAADADRNGKVTIEELRPLSEGWFRAQDADRNGKLTRREVPKPPPKPGG